MEHRHAEMFALDEVCDSSVIYCCTGKAGVVSVRSVYRLGSLKLGLEAHVDKAGSVRKVCGV